VTLNNQRILQLFHLHRFQKLHYRFWVPHVWYSPFTRTHKEAVPRPCSQEPAEPAGRTPPRLIARVGCPGPLLAHRSQAVPAARSQEAVPRHPRGRLRPLCARSHAGLHPAHARTYPCTPLRVGLCPAPTRVRVQDGGKEVFDSLCLESEN
jgi:hypothetical protein